MIKFGVNFSFLLPLKTSCKMWFHISQGLRECISQSDPPGFKTVTRLGRGYTPMILALRRLRQEDRCRVQVQPELQMESLSK